MMVGDPAWADPASDDRALEAQAIYVFAAYALKHQDGTTGHAWTDNDRAAYCHRLKSLIAKHGAGVIRTRGTPRSRQQVQLVARWMREKLGSPEPEIHRHIGEANGIKPDTIRRIAPAAPVANADPESEALPLPRIVTEPEHAACEPYDRGLVDKLDVAARSMTGGSANSLEEIGRILFAQNRVRAERDNDR
jgi:hypothetical protein